MHFAKQALRYRKLCHSGHSMLESTDMIVDLSCVERLFALGTSFKQQQVGKARVGPLHTRGGYRFATLKRAYQQVRVRHSAPDAVQLA